MKNTTLLVLAAGMGSRFNGLKQMASIGENGESILDYSVYDAVKSGFNKVVFVIRQEFEREFREKITKKFEDKINVEFVFQNLNYLPNGFSCPKDRKVPWGTGHAVLSASNIIKEPFCVINADDFYGYESFKKIIEFFSKDPKNLCMVYFKLGKTLSPFGGVNRAICNIDKGLLKNLIEKFNIQKKNNIILSNKKKILDSQTPVSMGMWGFRPSIFVKLEEIFKDFLKVNRDKLNSEFLIPEAINFIIQDQREKMVALSSDSEWYGITYNEDCIFVKDNIKRIVNDGEYQKELF